jgi:mannose-6-phosphate isomerase-like protein (cupin superfamily)
MEIKVRRVVTGHTQTNKSTFLSDGQPARVVTFDSLPGAALVELWATEASPNLPVTLDVDPTATMTSFVPGPLGTRFRMVRFPPAHEITSALPNGFDATAFQHEFAMKAPGLAESHEVEDSGMHTTRTVDYGVVLSGELWLELDDGSEVHLKPGECVIQNGTRHAWRNRGTEACLMAFVLIGTTCQ